MVVNIQKCIKYDLKLLHFEKKQKTIQIIDKIMKLNGLY
ncbi:hypothetical protein FLBR109950_06410 [Flavobacterium branchiophilum]